MGTVHGISGKESVEKAHEGQAQPTTGCVNTHNTLAMSHRAWSTVLAGGAVALVAVIIVLGASAGSGKSRGQPSSGASTRSGRCEVV